MRVLDLALKDLTQLVRDWKAAVFLVIMPVLFTLMFGLIFSGDGEEDPRLPVGLVDEDGSRAGAHLEALLETSAAIRPVRSQESLADADQKVQEDEWAAALLVPAGYGERLGSADPLPLTVILDEAALSGATARREIEGAVSRLMGAVEAADLSAASYAELAGPDAVETAAFWAASLELAVGAWANPPLTVQVGRSTAVPESGEDSVFGDNPYAHSSAAMMVQFAMAGLIGAAEIVVLERKSRALARLLTTAISRTEIILGHFIAMFLMLLVQFVLLTAFGHLVLGVEYYREPAATGVVMVTLALWAASLGLLIGVLARNEDQVVIFSLIPMFILSALGGAWMPLEFTPPAFQAAGHLTPTAWALDGLENIVIRGLGLESVLLPAIILLAYAAVFFAISAWRFKFE